MTTAALRAAGLVVAAGLFTGAGALLVPTRPVVVPVVLPSGRVINAELARTPAERARGLMFRRSMPSDAGMLIVFPTPGRHAIWMKNCRFPLDIVWLDARGRVVSIVENAPPCGSSVCTIYWPSGLAQYVLELVAGQSKTHGLNANSGVRFSPLRPRRVLQVDAGPHRGGGARR